jgi:hypothetical protein
MHKFTKIYLDMDGVIANFEKKYEELFGMLPAQADSHKVFGKQFAQFIQGKNFGSLELIPDAWTLMNYLNTCGVPVEILSSTARPENNNAIKQQKEVWLTAHGITYPTIFVPGKKLKAKYADENSILIDDTESNVDEWNAAGGTGILHKDALTTISILNTLLVG